MTPAEARQLLDQARVGRLATVDGAGRPHVVPLVFAIAGNTIVSAVDHKPKRSTALKRLANITANPGVSLLVDDYSDDWSQLWWVRVDGTASIIATGDIWQQSVAALADKYPQYRGHPPTGDVISISIDRLTGWKAGD